ncbi:unnamed protein product [Candida verbasci]|uniref:Sec1-like protein n=1 Tax=Candida verbasci TaxID=1227364 RepID=A0A9W4U064_9ASCO|nr:unnamed protein product [Candida verbasci]
MSKNKDPNSLLNIQHDFIYNLIKNVQIPGQLYNLILDDNSEELIYHVIQKEQLLRIVASIEKIDAKRRQSTYMTGIYFCDLNIYNLKCILSDVQTNRYKAGMGLFNKQISNPRNDKFWDSKFINQPKVLKYFNDQIQFINSNFYPVESRVFLPDNKTPNSMPIYYNSNCHDFVLPQVQKVANCLLNLMIVMDEYPLIRYYSPQQGNYEAKTLPQLIAQEFQQQLDEYYRNNESYSPQSNPNKQRAILLICDRTLDLYAPLLHEFSYQAMAMDIIESLERENVYKYQTENEKGEINDVETTLDNENDEDWINLRHLHIIESSELIYNKISELIKNNPMMIDRSKASTSSDLMYIVAHLKGFDEERKQLTLHKSLIDKCLDINANRKLAEFAADMEQTCCANGITFEGEKNSHLHDDLIVLLARDDLHINDKIRLILIYTFYRGGLIRNDFEKLIKFIGVNDKYITGLVEKCFNNVDKLGFELFKNSVKDKNFDKFWYHQINNEGTYNTSRFIPGVKRVLINATKHTLDKEQFPYSRDQPLEEDLPKNTTNNDLQSNGSLRNSRIKASWATNSRNSGSISSGKQKQRIFAFVAGGMTYSEIRSIYELTSSMNKEFYIGSESILKPRDFLIGLQSIGQNKNLQDLNLNIVKELTEQKEVPLYLYEDGRSSIPTNGQNNQYNQQPSLPKLSSQDQQFHQQVQQQQQIYQQKHKGEIPSTQAPSHYQKRQQAPQQLPPSSSDSSSSTSKSKRSKLKKLFK